MSNLPCLSPLPGSMTGHRSFFPLSPTLLKPRSGPAGCQVHSLSLRSECSIITPPTKGATWETLTKVRTKYSFWGTCYNSSIMSLDIHYQKKKKDKHHKKLFDYLRQCVPHWGVWLGLFYFLHGNLHFLFGAWINRLCWNLTFTLWLSWPLGPHVLSVLFDWCWLEPLAKVGHSLPEACLGVCTHCFPHRATRQRNAFYKAAVGLPLVSLKLNIWPMKTLWLTWYYIFWDVPTLT